MNQEDLQAALLMRHELSVFFRGTNEEKINFLTDGYQAWIKDQDLPNMSADELLYSDHPLTDSQRKILSDIAEQREAERKIAQKFGIFVDIW